ncbi:MAG TPA: hypothetical protein VGC48_05835, partial [Gemmatimonadales bacterium]
MSGPVLLFLCFALMSPPLLRSQDDSAASTRAGISNHGQNQTEPYVTAGDRAYLIGTQDGNFPDMGNHVPGEMGGLWVHPIKLIDGFWATITDSAAGDSAALSKSTDFVNYPYGNRLRYGPVLDSLEIERFQFSPDGYPGVIIQYTFANRSDRKRRLTFQLSVKTDLLPVWFSERLGITDAPDTVAWDAAQGRFLARDTEHPWFAVWGAIPSAGVEPVLHPEPIHTNGMGVSAASRYNLSVDPHGSSTLTFVFAGSARARKEAE